MDLVCPTVRAYEQGFLEPALGDTLRPGGMELTRTLLEMAQIQSGQRVLEIGSGKGETAIFLAKHFGCKVTGLDASYILTAQARQRARAQNIRPTQVRFIRGVAERLRFKGEQFDVVLAECFLSLCGDKLAVAQEVFRVLRKGGLLAFSDFIFTNRPDRQEELPLLDMFCLGSAGTEQEYRAVLREAGFHKVRVEKVPRVMRELNLQIMSTFGSLEGFWEAAGRQLGEKEATAPGRSYLQFMKATRPEYAIFLAQEEAC